MFFKIKPTYIVNHVRDINLQDLKDEGIKALIFDLDNTLMEPYAGIFGEEIEEWINEARKDFKIAILSNNLRAAYIQKVQSTVNFPVYGKAVKPFVAAALRVIKELDVLPEQCAIIGDTFLTDIVLGIRLKMVTILVDQLVEEGEPKYWQLVQKFERLFIKTPEKRFTEKLAKLTKQPEKEIHPEEKKEIKKIAVILNPMSGNIPIGIIKDEIHRGFEEYELFEMTHENNPYELTKNALEKGYEIIAASGGDGTVKEVISAIYGSDAKLGIIPSGTGNLIANNLGIPISLHNAIKLIKKGYTRKIDIGKINENYMVFMSGCGLNATVMEKTTQEKKKNLGYLAYFVEGIKYGYNPEYFEFCIKIDNNKSMKVKASTLLIANAANILGQSISIAPEATFFDGQMDLVIVSVFKKIDYFYAIYSILTREQYKKFSRIEHYKFRKLEITSEPILDVQVDGDILEKTPIKVEVIPSAVEVIVPNQ